MQGQQLLPGFEPSEKDLIEMALAAPLDKKIERAKLLLRHYERKALEMSPLGYYLCFSGGKDSCVIKRLASEAGVRFEAVYSNTTVDPPGLIRFMREHHKDVRWVNPPVPLLRMAEKKGLPMRTVRWCCQEYKEGNGAGKFKVLGVRITESVRRAKAWREFVPHRKDGTFFLCPVAYWTDADVWSFIRGRGLPYCGLYDEGKKRLGCVGCPMASKAQREDDFRRYPGYLRLYRRAAQRYFDYRRNTPRVANGETGFSTFRTAEEYWEWWHSGGQHEDDGEQCVFEQMMSNT